MGWTRALVAGAVVLTLLGNVACDSSNEAAEEPKPKKKRGRKREEPPPDPRPPAKAPRPPFLSLPEGAGEALAKDVLAQGVDRRLAFPAQRGPFGPKETVLVVWTEDVEGERKVGGVVIDGDVAYALPFTNDLPLDAANEVVWTTTERGWVPVVLIRRLQDGNQMQMNQIFAWDGQGYIRDLESEARVSGMSSPDAIRQALL